MLAGKLLHAKGLPASTRSSKPSAASPDQGRHWEAKSCPCILRPLWPVAWRTSDSPTCLQLARLVGSARAAGLQKQATHPRKQRSAGGIRGTLRWGAEAFQQVDQRVYRISGWWLRFRAGTLNHESAQQLPLRWHGASTLQLRAVAAILLWQIQE